MNDFYPTIIFTKFENYVTNIKNQLDNEGFEVREDKIELKKFLNAHVPERATNAINTSINQLLFKDQQAESFIFDNSYSDFEYDKT